MEFFDRNGQATCYSPDGENLYLWNGEPVGYFEGDKVYSFSGRLLGWIANGWLYDRSNQPALFSADASGGPMRPMRSMKPMKSMRQMRPMKAMRQAPHAKSVRGIGWSSCANGLYFRQ